MSRKMIVVGGGIGGMTAALALHRARVEVTVFERAPAFAEVGTGMSLWPNATRILESLGLLEQVMARGEQVTQFNLHRPDGRMISKVSMTGYPTPALCMHRAELHRILYQPLPARCLETNQVFQSFTQDAEGVTAKFAGGHEVRADGLIGADGINSLIRAQLHGAEPAAYRGYCIWRGLAPDPGGLVRGHISETWGAGQRFGLMPIGQGRICWYATRNGPRSQADAAEGRKAEVLELFRHWHGPIPALIEATPAASILKNDACDRPALRPWGRGAVTLLGDSAHPMTPNVGQGACMAIEDAAWLAKLLPGAQDVATAFRTYECRRQPRTAFIARQSRRIGMIGQWKNPLLVRGRNFITRLVLARPPALQLNAVYAYEV